MCSVVVVGDCGGVALPRGKWGLEWCGLDGVVVDNLGLRVGVRMLCGRELFKGRLMFLRLGCGCSCGVCCGLFFWKPPLLFGPKSVVASSCLRFWVVKVFWML